MSTAIIEPIKVPNPSNSQAEFDKLAESSISDPNAFSQLIDELKPRLYSFNQLNWNENEFSNNLKNELIRIKKHFSQLKIQFLHYETKQLILQSLGNNNNNNNNELWCQNLIDSIAKNNQSIDLLESEISQCKEALAALQSDNINESLKIIKLIPVVLKKYNSLGHLTKQFINSYNENHSNTQQQKILIENLLLFENVFEDNQIDENAILTNDGCERLIGLYKTKLLQVKSQIQSIEEKLSKIECEIDPMNKNLVSLHQRFQLSEQNLTSEQNLQTSKPNQEWCNQMTTTLNNFGGILIQQLGNSEFLVKVTADQHYAKIRLLLNSKGTKLIDAKIEESKKKIDFDEILKIGLKTQSIEFIIHETRAILMDFE